MNGSDNAIGHGTFACKGVILFARSFVRSYVQSVGESVSQSTSLLHSSVCSSYKDFLEVQQNLSTPLLMPVRCFTPPFDNPHALPEHFLRCADVDRKTPDNSQVDVLQQTGNGWNCIRNDERNVKESRVERSDTGSLMAYRVIQWPSTTGSGAGTSCYNPIYDTSQQQQQQLAGNESQEQDWKSSFVPEAVNPGSRPKFLTSRVKEETSLFQAPVSSNPSHANWYPCGTTTSMPTRDRNVLFEMPYMFTDVTDPDPLSQSHTSDQFGLNNSSSSVGLALNELVTKIIEDDGSSGFPALDESLTGLSASNAFSRPGNISRIWSSAEDGFLPSFRSGTGSGSAIVQPCATRRPDAIYDAPNHDVVSASADVPTSSYHPPFVQSSRHQFPFPIDVGGGDPAERSYYRMPGNAAFEGTSVNSSRAGNRPIENLAYMARTSVPGYYGDGRSFLMQKDSEALAGFSDAALRQKINSSDASESKFPWLAKPDGDRVYSEEYWPREDYVPNAVVNINSSLSSRFQAPSQSPYSPGFVPQPTVASVYPPVSPYSASDPLPPSKLELSPSSIGPFPAMALSLGHQGLSASPFSQPFNSYGSSPYLGHPKLPPFGVDPLSGSPVSPSLTDRILAAQIQRQLLENHLAMELLQRSLRDGGRVAQKFPHGLHPYPFLDPYTANPMIASAMLQMREMPLGKISPLLSPTPSQSGVRFPKRSGPATELHLRLEESYEQFRNIENERKKAEAELARQNPGKMVSSANSIVIPRLPVNPSRIDRLIVESYREHANVITLILRMEQIRSLPLGRSIHQACGRWLEGISKLQGCRRDEIINASNRHLSSSPQLQKEKDILSLASAMNELSFSTRQARTALWSSLQLSSTDLPKECQRSAKRFAANDSQSDQGISAWSQSERE